MGSGAGSAKDAGIQKEERRNVQELFGELQRIQGKRGNRDKVLEMVEETNLPAGFNDHHIDRSNQGAWTQRHREAAGRGGPTRRSS